jgi:hypothetical protein
MLPGCTRPRPQEPTRQAELVRWQQRDDEKPRAVNNGSGGARWLASAMDPASWLSWSRRTAASSRRRTPRPQPKTHVRQEGGRIRRARGNQPGQVTHRGAAWLAVVWEMTRLQDINIQSLYHTVHVLPPRSLLAFATHQHIRCAPRPDSKLQIKALPDLAHQSSCVQVSGIHIQVARSGDKTVRKLANSSL